MAHSIRRIASLPVLLFLVFAARPFRAAAQQSASASILQRVDASVARREKDLLAYTAIEHYAVFRNSSSAPIAEMTVKTTYRQDSGKTYQILSESGSELLRKELLARMLDSERSITQPAARAHALIDTANYSMAVKDEVAIDARPCVELQIAPRHAEPYLFKGSIWVDSRDGSIVRLQGVTSKPASVFAGPTKVSRQYEMLDGYPMATHAEAITSVMLLGQLRITIDYSNYQLSLLPAASTGVPAITPHR